MITVALAVVLAANVPATTDVSALQADVARLQQELREQKQLLLQFMQVDQQRYDMLLQIIRTTSGQVGAAPALPAVPGLPAAPKLPEPGGEAEKALKQAGTSGTVTGRVRLPHDVADAYVYVEGTRGASGRGKVLQ